jgi:Co/Zn/Cd efflux system component
MWVLKKEEMAKSNRKAMKKLVCVTVLTLIFVTIEVIGGIWSNSIAVISDAAHLLSDVLGIGVSIWALHIA